MRINLHCQPCQPAASLDLIEGNYPPALIEMDGALIYRYLILNDHNPFRKDWTAWRKYYLGGCRCKPDPEKFTRLPGTYLFAGHPFHKNYSHFTLSQFGAMLLFKYFDLLRPTTKIIAPQDLPFQRELLPLLGINKHNIVELADDTVYEIDRIIFANCYYNHFYHQAFLKHFEDFASRIRIKKDIKLYITRYGHNRYPVNEAEVIRYFLAKGYEVADFGKISVLQQIALVNSASVICANHGASGANLAFRNQDHFTFIEHFKSIMITHFHANLLLAKNCAYSGIVAPVEGPWPESPTSSFLFDIDSYENALDNPCHIFESTPPPRYMDAKAISEKFIRPYK